MFVSSHTHCYKLKAILTQLMRCTHAKSMPLNVHRVVQFIPIAIEPKKNKKHKSIRDEMILFWMQSMKLDQIWRNRELVFFEPYLIGNSSVSIVCRNAEFKFVSTSCRWNANSNNNNNITVKFLTHSQFGWFVPFAHSHRNRDHSLFLSTVIVYMLVNRCECAPILIWIDTTHAYIYIYIHTLSWQKRAQFKL